VRAVLEASGAWTFYVTVAHPDTTSRHRLG
jgi:hypothetical protein